jgi:DNA-binding MarR family transcriptional regulator
MPKVALEGVMAVADFRAALRRFVHRSEHRLREFGLTPQRYLLLLMIEGAPDGSRRLSFSELADRLKLERNTVTELVQRAEEAGLLEREPSAEDGRVVYLRLTKAGERCLYDALVANREARTEFARELEEAMALFRAIG